MNFYIPYEKLEKDEKKLFIPEEKVSFKKLFQVSIRVNINNDKSLCIYDGIFQVIKCEIRELIEKKERDKQRNKEIDEEMQKMHSNSNPEFILNSALNLKHHDIESTDDLALLRRESKAESTPINKVRAFDDLHIGKRNLDIDNQPQPFKRQPVFTLDGTPLTFAKATSFQLSKKPSTLMVSPTKGEQEGGRDLFIIQETPHHGQEVSSKQINEIFRDHHQSEKEQDLTRLYEF